MVTQGRVYERPVCVCLKCPESMSRKLRDPHQIHNSFFEEKGWQVWRRLFCRIPCQHGYNLQQALIYETAITYCTKFVHIVSDGWQTPQGWTFQYSKVKLAVLHLSIASCPMLLAFSEKHNTSRLRQRIYQSHANNGILVRLYITWGSKSVYIRSPRLKGANMSDRWLDHEETHGTNV